MFFYFLSGTAEVVWNCRVSEEQVFDSSVLEVFQRSSMRGFFREHG